MQASVQHLTTGEQPPIEKHASLVVGLHKAGDLSRVHVKLLRKPSKRRNTLILTMTTRLDIMDKDLGN
jgi:hypothetical protein